MKIWISVVLFLLVPRSAGSPASVFRTTGASVTLEFQQHRQLKRESVGSVVWKFGQDRIMKYIPHMETVKILGHEGRLEFHKETFSLELKNLQKIDGGLYRGEITAEEIDVEAEYRLSVLDPVESPLLSVEQSCDNLSNVTVTCRGRDLSLTSTCNSSSCSPEGGASSDSTLTLSFKDDIITCNHSNLVSWKDTSMDITTLCPLYSDMESTANYIWCLIPVMLGLCAFGCCAAMFLQKKRHTGSKESVENPIYTCGEQRLEAASSSETIYSVVKKHNNHML